MKAPVKKIAEQVKALLESELDEFLSRLAEYEVGHPDYWDKEIERDSQNGGPLSPMLKRIREDIDLMVGTAHPARLKRNVRWAVLTDFFCMSIAHLAKHGRVGSRDRKPLTNGERPQNV
jgi:hypothetical protein